MRYRINWTKVFKVIVEIITGILIVFAALEAMK